MKSLAAALICRFINCTQLYIDDYITVTFALGVLCMPVFPLKSQSSKLLRKTFLEMLCMYDVIQSRTLP